MFPASTADLRFQTRRPHSTLLPSHRSFSTTTATSTRANNQLALQSSSSPFISPRRPLSSKSNPNSQSQSQTHRRRRRRQHHQPMYIVASAAHESESPSSSHQSDSINTNSTTTTTTSDASQSTSTATAANATADKWADARTQLSQFGAGALAGLVNTLVLSPLDVVKTRLQAQGSVSVSSSTAAATAATAATTAATTASTSASAAAAAARTASSSLASATASTTSAAAAGVAASARAIRYTGTLDAFRSMLREEGLRSYYRGLSASLWAFVPNWAIYWYTYETFKRTYTPKGQRPSPVVHVLSALSAGGITAVTTAPFWTLKSRLQVDMSMATGQRRYRSVPHGFRTIVREEGVMGLYKGLIPTLLGLGHVAIQFPLYEYLKTRFSARQQLQAQQQPQLQQLQHEQQKHQHQRDVQQPLKASHVLMASSLSKAVASAIFYPHEVIRTRIQVDDRVIRNSSELSRAVGLFKDIVRRDGVKGLYRGFGANLVRTVPACMLTFTSYELAKRFAESQSLKHQQSMTNTKNLTSTSSSSYCDDNPTTSEGQKER